MADGRTQLGVLIRVPAHGFPSNGFSKQSDLTTGRPEAPLVSVPLDEHKQHNLLAIFKILEVRVISAVLYWSWLSEAYFD